MCTRAERGRGGRTAWVACLALVGTVVLGAAAAFGQAVGAVAALDGTVEIGRGGTWTPAALAAPINQGDQIRTSRPGRVRIVFADESVLELTDGSLITVDEQLFDPSAGSARSTIQLLSGKLRALVSDYYQQSGNAYEIKTLTAVAGVRGTTFIVAYDGADTTEVVGVDGFVAVQGIPARGAEVQVTTGELSVVSIGTPPSPARRLDDAAYQRFLNGFSFIGAGAAESQAIGLPLIAGAQLPDIDRAIQLPPFQVSHGGIPLATDILIPVQDAGTVAGQPLPIVEAAGRLRIRLF